MHCRTIAEIGLRAARRLEARSDWGTAEACSRYAPTEVTAAMEDVKIGEIVNVRCATRGPAQCCEQLVEGMLSRISKAHPDSSLPSRAPRGLRSTYSVIKLVLYLT